MRKSTFLWHIVFAAAMVAVNGYTPANHATQDCGYAYFVAWKGCPKWPSSQYSGNAKFYVSNVFSECEIVKTIYGYTLTPKQQKRIKSYMLDHYELEDEAYYLTISPVVLSGVGGGATTPPGSETFASKEEAIKERGKLINYIKNSPNAGGVLAPSINAYPINTTNIETVYY